MAAVWFGLPAGVVAATTAPGDKPAAAWLGALLLSVLLLGVAGGALVAGRRPLGVALGAAAALAVGLDLGVSVAFVAGGACAVENGRSCSRLSAIGAVLLLVPAFLGFLGPVLVGRRIGR